MDIKRMRKAELIELNGQLNEAREHCDAVIEALRAELAAARAEIELLKSGLAQRVVDAGIAAGIQDALAERPVATPPAQAHRVSHSVVRNNKLVHEFDPDVPGSYLNAMRRCRELGGVVRRARQ